MPAGPGGYWKVPPNTHVSASDDDADTDPDPRCDVVGCYEIADIRAGSADDAITGHFIYCSECAERQLDRFADLYLLPGLPGDDPPETETE